MNIFFPKQKKGENAGFTLVELLVSIAIFVVIVTFSLGSVLSIMDAGQKSKSLNSVMTNLNFTLEVMSREIKFGTHYSCFTSNSFPPSPPPTFVPYSPANCTGLPGVPAGNSISFVTSDGFNTVYTLDSVNHQIEKSSNGGAPGSYIGVTAPEVVITGLQFYVFNSSPQSVLPPDNLQPKVIIVVRGFAGVKPSTQSSFVLQTTVSQRALDQ